MNIMACRKLSSELQQLLVPRCNKILDSLGSYFFSLWSSDDECKEPPPAPEPRPDLTMLTHTNQVWTKEDYRNIRFLNTKRWVNKNIPMHLGHARPSVKSSERVISCGGEPLNHPIVFINVDKPGYHSCFYCGQTFEKKEEKHEENKQTTY